MAITPTKTTYSLKFTGKAANATFNKTISGITSGLAASPGNANEFSNAVFDILDSGTATAFTISTANSYDATLGA